LPRLQLGADRVNPGGALEVIGDLKAEGGVEVTLVTGAGGATYSLGTIWADHDGHFQAFVTIPVDAPTGSYSLLVRSGVDEATVGILVAGLPVSAGDEGQPPGQDEARAAAVTASNVAPQITAQLAPEPAVGEPSVGVIPVAIAILVAIGLALGIGTLARVGSRRSAR
jgi:hypothetical protein